MKVCLIDTAASHSRRFIPHWTPLGLAYIGAQLENGGHEVLIVERDVLFRKNGLKLEKTDQAMVEKLLKFRPDLVGISSPTELFHDASHSARLVKTSCKNVPIVYGGHHASAVPEEVLEACREIDMVAVNEGELTMLEIADGLPYGEIKGLVFRDGKSIIKNPSRPGIDNLDNIPIPARHLLDMNFHTRYSHLPVRNLTLRSTTMLTSRGCPFNCSFCVESLPFGKKHRFHSSARVIEELEGILNAYNIDGIYFLDEGFLKDEERVRELCDALIKEGYNKNIKWTAQARVDSINKDILGLMKEAGCVQLECGFETASDRILKDTRKGTSYKRNSDIIRLIKSSGMRCVANMIFGLPGETEQEFNQTLEFIKKSGFNFVVFSKFRPHPGCAIYIDLIEKGIIRKGFWINNGEFYDKQNFTEIPDEKFDAMWRGAFKNVIERINTTDRMKNLSIARRIRALSLDELLQILSKSPGLILKFFSDFLSAKLIRNHNTGKH